MKNPYARYGVKLLALVLALLLPFAAYFAWAQSLPAQFTHRIVGTLHHKLTLLETTSTPRLILAGGSSSPYGTDCAYIADTLNIPCINVGTTVYIGVDIYLSMLEKYMLPGDIIVLGPEHSMLSHVINYQVVWQAIENSPSAWSIVPSHYWPHLLTSYYAYASEKAALAAGGNVPASYHPDFGPLGDVVAPREALLESGYNRLDLIALSPAALDADVARQLRAFYEKAQARGVQVYLIHAPVDELAVTTSPADWAALEEALRSQTGIPLLAPLSASVMEGKYFYDTNNHLTTEGAAIYSRLLAESLRPYLNA